MIYEELNGSKQRIVLRLSASATTEFESDDSDPHCENGINASCCDVTTPAVNMNLDA